MKKYLALAAALLAVLLTVSCSGGTQEAGHVHEYAAETVAATCTEGGYTLHRCACGNEYRDGETPAAGHVPVTDPAVAATCTGDGKTEGTHCSVCGEVLTAQTAIPAAHVPGEAETVKEATCTEAGLKRTVCTVCGETVKEEETEKTAHTPSEQITDEEATCTKTGRYRTVCTVCGCETGTGVIPMAEHTPSEPITDEASTCTKAGKAHRECTECGELLGTEDLPLTEHVPSGWVTDTAASCTKEGSAHRSCTECGCALDTKTLPKTEHVPSDWITDTAATCTAEGKAHKNCTVCGAVVQNGTLPKTGHAFGAWTTVKAATCQAEGQEKRTCSKCGAAETRSTAKTSHNYVGGKCSVCGAFDPTIGTLANPLPADNSIAFPYREYQYIGSTYRIGIKCCGLMRGNLGAALAAEENMFNAKASSTQEWRFYLFRVGYASLESGSDQELDLSGMFYKSNFFKKSGSTLPVYATATLSGSLGVYSQYGISLYPGGAGDVIVGLLVDKNAGDVYLKLPLSGGGVCWLSCTPADVWTEISDLT